MWALDECGWWVGLPLPPCLCNLSCQSLEQLRGVCAAHGFVPKGVSKADVLHEIEMELDSDKPLMLKAGGEPTLHAAGCSRSIFHHTDRQI